MKTAEDWLTDPRLKKRGTEQDVVEWIQQIQSDAHRDGVLEGLRMAQEMCAFHGLASQVAKRIEERITELEKGKAE